MHLLQKRRQRRPTKIGTRLLGSKMPVPISRGRTVFGMIVTAHWQNYDKRFTTQANRPEGRGSQPGMRMEIGSSRLHILL